MKYTQNTLHEKTDFSCKVGSRKPQFFTLEWEYKYEYQEDEVFFAQFQPYTYSDLLKYLKQTKESHAESNIVRMNTLCKTVAKNACPILTITENVDSYLPFHFQRQLMGKSHATRQIIMSKVEKLRSRLLHQQNARGKKAKRNGKMKDENSNFADLAQSIANAYKMVDLADPQFGKEQDLIISLLKHQEYHNHKKGMFFTARVHPGEVPGSWIMKGLIDYLLSDAPEAKYLRSHYVFQIVPMLNPDGVIYGNYRCSLLGFDLNRKWKYPNKHLQPTIYYSKQMIKLMSEEREITLYCDFHAHSFKKNVFMYGCSYKPAELDQIRKNAAVRVFPLLMSQHNSNFSYKNSKFRMEKRKEATARIVVFKEFNVISSYTCEASFFG